MEQFLQINFLSKLFCSAFLAILFLQSGLDKVLDWKGNLSWLKGHFGKTFLKNAVPLLLGIITLTEGILSHSISSAKKRSRLASR